MHLKATSDQKKYANLQNHVSAPEPIQSTSSPMSPISATYAASDYAKGKRKGKERGREEKKNQMRYEKKNSTRTSEHNPNPDLSERTMNAKSTVENPEEKLPNRINQEPNSSRIQSTGNAKPYLRKRGSPADPSVPSKQIRTQICKSPADRALGKTNPGNREKQKN
ncbi:hypothetical protein VTO42DRAFT_687 [Malbranchea cinnamomea]